MQKKSLTIEVEANNRGQLTTPLKIEDKKIEHLGVFTIGKNLNVWVVKKLSLVILLVLAFSLTFISIGWAELINLQVITRIESGGNPQAISKAGAVGLYQIMPCVLQEYNARYNLRLSKKDLYNPEVNAKIASWYFNNRIPQLLRYYKKEVTIKNVLWAYNAGIGNVVKGRLPLETKNYLIKYDKLTKK